jgi:radical SAM superfamily enzyme YgiQ (UPF0313 family)
MKRNIYFFQFNFAIGFGKFKTYWLPYAVARLWSYAKTFDSINNNWQASEFYFERRPYDKIIEELDNPSVAAFSCYIWNWNYNLGLAKRIKEKWPECKIVFGGPQVPNNSGRLDTFYKQNTYVDYTFHGESEKSFVGFMEYLNGNVDTLPPGITYSGSTNSTENERVENLAMLVSPFLNGVMDSVIAKHRDKNFSVTLETNRGCPYQCTFCDWGSLTFNKVKTFGSDIVKAEIDWISKNGIKFVDVADANFGIHKERDFDLLRHMVMQKEATGFPESYSFNWQKNSTDFTLQMVEFLTEHNSARGFTLSTQSMDDAVLKNIKRRNLEVSNFSGLLNKCNSLNIQTYTELILGLPGETKASWMRGVNKLLTNGQHNNIEVWLCQMLENAELNSDAEILQYGIETTPIHNYISGENQEDIIEGIQVIKSTATLSFDDLIDCYMYSWMITNFHSFGWTQILSRYHYQTNKLSYKVFYDSLLEHILADKFLSQYYHEVRKNIVSAFETGIIQGRGMHYYISEFQKKLHLNRKSVMDSIAEFSSKLAYVTPESVNEFTECYITDYNKPKKIEKKFDIAVWDIINNQPTTSSTYIFTWGEDVANEQEYYDSFYFRRRKGWGKMKVVCA